MSAIANMTIMDGQTTPVAHVFKHKSHSAVNVTWVDSTTGLANAARPSIELTRLPSKDKNVRKVRAKAVMPVMETVSGNTAEGYVADPKKIGESVVICDMIFHNRAPEQAIADLRVYLRDLLSSANTQFFDAITYDQFPY